MMRGRLFVFFGFVFIILPNAAYSNHVVITECLDTQYFDFSALQCSECGNNQVASSNGLGCTCQPGFRIIESELGITCESCLQYNKAPTLDKRQCLYCDGTTNATLSTSKGDCVCPLGRVLVERDSRGGLLDAKQCLPCGDLAYPVATAPAADASDSAPTTSTYDPWTMRPIADYARSENEPAYPAWVASPRRDVNMCRPCGAYNMALDTNGNCTCPSGYELKADALCLSSARINSLGLRESDSKIKFMDTRSNTEASSFESASTGERDVKSLLVTNHFVPASVLCATSGDRTACNALGNLCVLSMYDKSSAACARYLKQYSTADKFVNDFPSWPRALPWLYYFTESSGELDNGNIAMEIAFDNDEGRVSQLHFVLASYSLNGTWLGLEDLNYQLQLCPSHPTGSAAFRRVGVTYEAACTIDLNELLDRTPTDARAYDLYIEDVGSGYYPVPVRVHNYRDETGNQPNLNPDLHSDRDSVLVRRFLLWDNLSGRETDSGDPKVLRFASAITLRVSLMQGASNRIVPPVLDITYAEVLASAVRAGKAKPNALSTAPVSFRVEYTMGLNDYNIAVYVLFAVFGTIAAALLLVRMWTYMRLYQTPSCSPAVLVRSFFALLQYASNVLLLLLVALSWFFFFKCQGRAFVMMPLLSDLGYFYGILAVATAFKLASLLYGLVVQSRADVFFIDWEQSQGLVQVGAATRPAPVCMWRRVAVTKKWADLQALRATNYHLTYVIMAVLLVGASMDNFATWQPDLSDMTSRGGGIHPLLRFALIALFYLIAYVVEYAVVRLYWLLHADPCKDFAELLSLQNISLLLLTSDYHGFYIHGKSPHAHVDTDMAGILEQLTAEENAKVATRYLAPGCECLTFELYITPDIRRAYDDTYVSRLPPAYRKLARRSHAAMAAAEKNVVVAYGGVRDFLIKWLQDLQNHNAVDIQDTNFVWRAIGFPPDMVQTKHPIFVKDPQCSFRSALLCGLEFELVTFELLAFACCDVWFANNTTLSCFLVWGLCVLLERARALLGRANILRKTCTDPRFVI